MNGRGATHVQFRSGALTPELSARQDARLGSIGQVAERDLGRYYHALAGELSALHPPLTQAEASLLLDAGNGVYWEPHTMRLLWAGVADAIRLERLDAKWRVDGAALVERLRALTPGQAAAVVDACERAWRLLGGPEPPTLGEALRRVGLVR